LLRRAYLRK